MPKTLNWVLVALMFFGGVALAVAHQMVAPLIIMVCGAFVISPQFDSYLTKLLDASLKTLVIIITVFWGFSIRFLLY